MKKRILSILLTFCMVVTLIPMSVFATEGTAPIGASSIEDATLCEHHTEHNEDCGYSSATEEQPCNHEHDEACGFIPAVTASPATEGIPCNKECTDKDGDGVIDHADDCAYTPATEEISAVEGAPCGHEHDENCRYAPARVGTACEFVCEECEKALDEPIPSEDSAPLLAPRSAAEYGGFLVTVVNGDDPAFADGVLTFGTGGEYTIAMKAETASTSNRIVVSASGVTLNLNGITVGAPQAAPGDEGLHALSVQDGTILNVTADSTFVGGIPGGRHPTFGSSGTCGGNGIQGSPIIKGSATLTATGQQGTIALSCRPQITRTTSRRTKMVSMIFGAAILPIITVY